MKNVLDGQPETPVQAGVKDLQKRDIIVVACHIQIFFQALDSRIANVDAINELRARSACAAYPRGI
jgi:hypothetical protein